IEVRNFTHVERHSRQILGFATQQPLDVGHDGFDLGWSRFFTRPQMLSLHPRTRRPFISFWKRQASNASRPPCNGALSDRRVEQLERLGPHGSSDGSDGSISVNSTVRCSCANMSQTDRNSAARTGPATNPAAPNTDKPPSVDRRIM